MLNIKFDEDGDLEDRIHQMSGEEFIRIFCSPGVAERDRAVRGLYAGEFLNLLKWAKENNADSVLVGGSFVTSKPNPSDIDVLIAFRRRELIAVPPDFSNGKSVFDVQLVSEDEPEILQSFLKLLGMDRRWKGRGLVQIKLRGDAKIHEKGQKDSELLAAVMAGYLHRVGPSRKSKDKLIIPIHGIRSDASWFGRFSFLATTSGWSVAPFSYGFESGGILWSEDDKKKVVDEFRIWVNDIRKSYSGSISVVAHSFGSYIFGRYLRDAGDISESFGGVVLTGSILNSSYDWRPFLQNKKVGMVLNFVAPNDGWVDLMPNAGKLKQLFISDSLMGRAAVDGFLHKHPFLLSSESKLIDHNNMFHEDVISRVWLPFLSMAESQVPVEGSWVWSEADDDSAVWDEASYKSDS